MSYELFRLRQYGDAELAQSTEFIAKAERHERMLANYRAQEWSYALAALAECRAADPALAGLYALYAERIDHFLDNPPGEDWDGIFVAETK